MLRIPYKINDTTRKRKVISVYLLTPDISRSLQMAQMVPDVSRQLHMTPDGSRASTGSLAVGRMFGQTKKNEINKTIVFYKPKINFVNQTVYKTNWNTSFLNDTFDLGL